MTLPLWIVMFLPKSLREKQIKLWWRSKSDEQILFAYKDAADWLSLIGPGKFCDTPEIYVKVKQKLDDYILPEMRRRNLLTVKE